MCFTCDFGLLGVCVSRGRSVLRSIVVMSVAVTRYAGLCLFRLPCRRVGSSRSELWWRSCRRRVLPAAVGSSGYLRPAICVACAWHVTPTLPVAPAQLMRPGIGRNASCAMGDWLTSRPKGCSQPRELWFFDILMYEALIYAHHFHCCRSCNSEYSIICHLLCMHAAFSTRSNWNRVVPMVLWEEGRHVRVWGVTENECTVLADQYFWF